MTSRITDKTLELQPFIDKFVQDFIYCDDKVILTIKHVSSRDGMPYTETTRIISDKILGFSLSIPKIDISEWTRD